MKAPELLLGLYDAFAPTEQKEKARVRSEIMTEWDNIVTDKTSSNYKKGDFWHNLKTTVKENTDGGWTSLFTGIAYPFLFKWFTEWMQPSSPDDVEDDGIRSLKP